MPPVTENTPVRFSDPLPVAVDVVVVGAGVAGTATAYFLAGRGQKVLLCEKGRVAGEQSSRNWGWIRQQGRDHAELPIMMESNRIWQGLAKETGERDLAFTQGGCLYLASGPAEIKKYEARFALAKRHQLDTRMLTKAELESSYPGLGASLDSQASIEEMLGIEADLSSDEIKQHLRAEFQKWNNRLNALSEGEERDNAQQMLNLIADARKKYG